MKNFRRLCFAVVLAAVFSVSALADPGATQGPPEPGDGHSPGAAAPAPGQTDTPPSAAGQIPTPPSAAGETHGPGATVFGDIASPGFLATLLALLRMP